MSFCRLWALIVYAVTGRKYMQKMHLAAKCHGNFINLHVIGKSNNCLVMYREEEFSRLEINLNGCLENYRYFRSKLSEETKLLVLVKANAYGHGAVEFASLMEDAGADYLAVAYPVEGIELRQGGIKSPIIALLQVLTPLKKL